MQIVLIKKAGHINSIALYNSCITSAHISESVRVLNTAH